MDSFQETIGAFDQQAAAYQARFMDLDLYDDTYAAFCRLIPQVGARILELGCGPGNITRYLLRHRPDFNVLATDAAPGMVALAQRNNPAATCQLLDVRQLSQLPGTFEGIISGFCLPYLPREATRTLLTDCATHLTAGGALYLSAIEGDYRQSGYQLSSSGQHRSYVYYYQAADLQAELQHSGLRLVGVQRKTMGTGPNATHLILLAQKP
jgi:cyclopropane fatty-acyl-phospholipid synthase-like methyltransferase